MVSLIVVGPDGPRQFRLGKGAVSVGREEGNTLVLNDRELSRRHCVIEPQGDSWRIRDLGSRNGVAVNGARVSEQQLNPGDVVRIGTHSIRIELAEAAAQSSVAIPQSAPGDQSSTFAFTESDARTAPRSRSASGEAARATASDPREQSRLDSAAWFQRLAPNGLIGRIGWPGLLACIGFPILLIGFNIPIALRTWTPIEWAVKLPVMIFISTPLFWITAFLIWPIVRPIHAFLMRLKYGGVVAVVGTRDAIAEYKMERFMLLHLGHFFLASFASAIVAMLPMFAVDELIGGAKGESPRDSYAVESSVKSQLQTIRGQIVLYSVRSNGKLPTTGTDGLPFEGATGTLVTPGDLDGDGVDESAFIAKPPIAPKGFVWMYDANAVAPDPVFWVTYTGTETEWRAGGTDDANLW